MTTEIIDIFGKPYEVRYQPEAEMQGNLGSAWRTHQRIFVDESLPQGQQEETLLHEIIHVIDGELKLELKEETVARLAVGLYAAGYKRRTT